MKRKFSLPTQPLDPSNRTDSTRLMRKKETLVQFQNKFVFFHSNSWKCCHFRCLRNKHELHRGSQHCVHLKSSTASSKHCTFSSHCLSPRFKKCPAVKTSLEWAAKTPTKAGKIFPEFVEISSRQNLHSFAALGKQIILARVWKLAQHTMQNLRCRNNLSKGDDFAHMMQENLDKQDQVSTMQQTGWTYYWSFPVCSGCGH